MTLRRWYESLLAPIAHYAPDYSLTRIVRDGKLRAPRIVILAQWAVYAGAIVAVLVGVSDVRPPLLLLWFTATMPLLGVKLLHVDRSPTTRTLWHSPDPLDWLCDVGACGSFGALLTAQLLGHYDVAPAAYVAIVVLFALTYAWSSP
jgi:hypothetical protein